MKAPALPPERASLPVSFQRESASFRDPASRVFYLDGRVLRGLSGRGILDWEALSRTPFFERLVAEGRLVRTDSVDPHLLVRSGQDWAAAVEHDAVPFLSYPFEWSFGMLKDAALLHLQVLLEALDEGMTMKDGSAYNVQWWGTSPRFIDVSSFTMGQPGPWPGYNQFCETFLNPLFLQSHRGVDYQPWLRGRLEGVPVNDMRRLLSARHLLRRGVFKHVFLHTVMQRFTKAPSQATRASLNDAGFGAEVARVTVERVLRVVDSLSWRPHGSHWASYGSTAPYTSDDRNRKMAFVEDGVRYAGAKLVWDLGCNDGTYARVAAKHADYVVAVDADHATVEALYRSLRTERNERVLPLVMNLADPTPELGWRNAERRAFTNRARPGLVMCLALVHHLALGANVPIAEIVAWLRSMDCPAVVEFVARDDPMAQQMLANKPIPHDDYSTPAFEAALSRSFSFERREDLGSGTRTLYLVAPL